MNDDDHWDDHDEDDHNADHFDENIPARIKQTSQLRALIYCCYIETTTTSIPTNKTLVVCRCSKLCLLCASRLECLSCELIGPEEKSLRMRGKEFRGPALTLVVHLD